MFLLLLASKLRNLNTLFGFRHLIMEINWKIVTLLEEGSVAHFIKGGPLNNIAAISFKAYKFSHINRIQTFNYGVKFENSNFIRSGPSVPFYKKWAHTIFLLLLASELRNLHTLFGFRQLIMELSLKIVTLLELGPVAYFLKVGPHNIFAVIGVKAHKIFTYYLVFNI